MKEKELNNFMMNNLKDIRNINEETIKYYLNINNINLKNYKDNLHLWTFKMPIFHY